MSAFVEKDKLAHTERKICEVLDYTWKYRHEDEHIWDDVKYMTHVAKAIRKGQFNTQQLDYETVWTVISYYLSEEWCEEELSFLTVQ